MAYTVNNFHSLETGETSKSKVKVLVDLVSVEGGLWFAAPLQPLTGYIEKNLSSVLFCKSTNSTCEDSIIISKNCHCEA